jgi:ligand-binding SRPBCC domain-containing protein
MDFHIITPSPIEMRCGALIDYTVRILGLRRRWTTLIAEFDPPRRFVDVQLRGPYSFWHHTHTFETDGAGTLVIDDIRYVLPLGVLGRVAHGLIVKPQLDRIFDFRRRTIQDMFSQVDDHASREHRLSNRD